eukprot:TRINITY_DN3489_c0_g1_i3.p1 TRINITY_DN3489_c0_g1~~TRINITY_DN3489_c0_g1_i3.p1  ORF type:complete len:548 (-),score=163.99 TRINITY_DN3489_c0_g1_i3:276-1919(-)
MAMEALPIFLDRLVPSVVAIIMSVTFVLFFGEVIPQAICTANPLNICAKTAWIVSTLMFLSYPVSYPVAKLLDRILGDHSAHILFRRSELTHLVALHSVQKEGPLQKDEVQIISGALELNHKKVKDVMTPFEYVNMLDIDRILDMDSLAEILGMGHSRIPVFAKSRHNVKGLLLVKRLIVCNPDDTRPVRHFMHRKPIVVPPTIGLYDLLNQFQTGRSHLAIVSEHTREYDWALRTGEDVMGYCRILGIVTLEDVVEELIKEEIEDEVDVGLAASNRPLELEQERLEHRKIGVERAKKKIRQFINRIRERRRGRSRGLSTDDPEAVARVADAIRRRHESSSPQPSVTSEDVHLDSLPPEDSDSVALTLESSFNQASNETYQFVSAPRNLKVGLPSGQKQKLISALKGRLDGRLKRSSVASTLPLPQNQYQRLDDNMPSLHLERSRSANYYSSGMVSGNGNNHGYGNGNNHGHGNGNGNGNGNGHLRRPHSTPPSPRLQHQRSREMQQVQELVAEVKMETKEAELGDMSLPQPWFVLMRQHSVSGHSS